MKNCCLGEAKKNLKRHHDVARCDDCGALLLAYGNDRDFVAAQEELESHELVIETAALGRLKILAKPA